MSKITVVGSSNMDITVRTPHIPAKGETVFGGDVMMSGLCRDRHGSAWMTKEIIPSSSCQEQMERSQLLT